MNKSLIDFTTIYNQYKVLVYNVALNYLQNSEDAEEITQDVFVKVYQSISKFNNNASLKTWIYRITINESLDFIKRKNSKKRFFIFGNRSKNEFEYLKTSNFEHPGILLENKENAKILFDVIHTLPEYQKTAFILSKLDGLSNPEIAAIMKTTTTAVGALVFRAKTALQEKLENKFKEYRKK